MADADNLYIYTPEYESSEDNRDYAEFVYEAIKETVGQTSIRTFVIDSITAIAARSFGKNASPSFVMKRLVAMKTKYRLSILAVADDTSKTSTKSLVALAATDFTVPDEKDTENSPESKSTDFLPGNHQSNDIPANQTTDNQRDISYDEYFPIDDYEDEDDYWEKYLSPIYDQDENPHSCLPQDDISPSDQPLTSSHLTPDAHENRRKRRLRRRHRKQHARKRQGN